MRGAPACLALACACSSGALPWRTHHTPRGRTGRWRAGVLHCRTGYLCCVTAPRRCTAAAPRRLCYDLVCCFRKRHHGGAGCWHCRVKGRRTVAQLYLYAPLLIPLVPAISQVILLQSCHYLPLLPWRAYLSRCMASWAGGATGGRFAAGGVGREENGWRIPGPDAQAGGRRAATPWVPRAATAKGETSCWRRKRRLPSAWLSRKLSVTSHYPLAGRHGGDVSPLAASPHALYLPLPPFTHLCCCACWRAAAASLSVKRRGGYRVVCRLRLAHCCTPPCLLPHCLSGRSLSLPAAVRGKLLF